jgi:glyoxylase I family protein
MQIELIHHVSLGVRDLERSKAFYREILGLQEITRPPFHFPGAWFGLGGGQQLHLIVHPHTTFRGGKGIDTRDNHLAFRVASYRAAREFLHSKGFREDADELDQMRLQANPNAVAGFPQMYILDPDRHVIEINAAKLD